MRFRDFNALLESGIIQTVRQLKQSLDTSFFHPECWPQSRLTMQLSAQKFDELFRAAVKEIKTFADDLEEQGGTILGSVDGVDVTVDHVKAMDENRLLKLDYGNALEKFRRVLKSEADTRATASDEARIEGERSSGGCEAGSQEQQRVIVARPVFNLKAMRKAVTPQQLAAEETKLLKVEESVQDFRSCSRPQISPGSTHALFQPDAHARRSRRLLCRLSGRKKFACRGGTSAVAPGCSECAPYYRTGGTQAGHNSPSLWKLHADSLVALLEIGGNASRKRHPGVRAGLASVDIASAGRRNTNVAQ